MSDQKTEQKTLRDEFAMAALSGCLSGVLACGRSLAPGEHVTIADTAYIFADAMLEARTQEPRHD